MDVESVLTYFAGNVALGNWNTYSVMGHNYYLYETPENRIAMLPWDMNLSQVASTALCPNDVERGNLRGIGGGEGFGGSRDEGGRPDFGGEPPEGFDDGELPDGFDGGEPPEGLEGGGAIGGGFGGGEAPLHDALLSDADSMARYRELLESFITGPASVERLSAQIDVAQGALGSLLTLDVDALSQGVQDRIEAITTGLPATNTCE